MDRANRTTTATRTVLSTVTGERNQVTGSNLTGFGNITEGGNSSSPAVGFCVNDRWLVSNLVEDEPEDLRNDIVVVFDGQGTVIGQARPTGPKCPWRGGAVD